MTDQFIGSLEWSGESIQIGKDGKFYVPLLEKSYDIAQAAKDAIDRKLTQLEKVAKRKMNLAIVSTDLVERAITGVHAGTGARLISPKIERYPRSSNIYPKHDNVVTLLKRKIVLKRLLNEVEAQLGTVDLMDEYYLDKNKATDVRFDEIEQDWQRKMAAADSLDITAGVLSETGAKA